MRIPNGVAWRLLFPHECIDCDGEIATPMMHERATRHTRLTDHSTSHSLDCSLDARPIRAIGKIESVFV